MNIFNFCGSGSGGSGGTSVLIQYQKTVDSSHNTQMIVADYPYQAISQVEVLAPVMETRTIDASYGALTIDRDTENYVGLERVIVNSPRMKHVTLIGNKDSSTIYNIVDEGDVAAGYVGIEQVTLPPVSSDVDSNIVPENIRENVNILGVTGTVIEAEYDIIYQRLLAI